MASCSSTTGGSQGPLSLRSVSHWRPCRLPSFAAPGPPTANVPATVPAHMMGGGGVHVDMSALTQMALLTRGEPADACAKFVCVSKYALRAGKQGSSKETMSTAEGVFVFLEMCVF